MPAKKSPKPAAARAAPKIDGLVEQLTKKRLPLWDGADELVRQGLKVTRGADEVLVDVDGDQVALVVVFADGPQWRVKTR